MRSTSPIPQPTFTSILFVENFLDITCLVCFFCSPSCNLGTKDCGKDVFRWSFCGKETRTVASLSGS